MVVGVPSNREDKSEPALTSHVLVLALLLLLVDDSDSDNICFKLAGLGLVFAWLGLLVAAQHVLIVLFATLALPPLPQSSRLPFTFTSIVVFVVVSFRSCRFHV